MKAILTLKRDTYTSKTTIGKLYLNDVFICDTLEDVCRDINRDGDLDAAGLTDATQKNAVNYLVINLKSIGVWTKLFALYPFVGGTATTHKYNLKNPLDSNAAFRLTFGGTVTHDANGVTFALANGYANSHLTPNATFTTNREALFLYSRTSSATATVNEIDMGAAIIGTQRDQLQIRTSADTAVTSINSSTVGSGTVSATGVTNGTGFFVGSRILSTDLRLYRNGSQIGSTSSTVNNGTRSNLKIYIGARNVSNAPNGFTGRNFALAGMSAELSSTEVSDMYTVVQQYQTILSRQV